MALLEMAEVFVEAGAPGIQIIPGDGRIGELW